MARPTKCDALLTAAVCKRITTGAPLNIAAAAEGATAPDLSHWRRHAAAGTEPYATFFNEAARARAQYLSAAVQCIDAASYGDDGTSGDWKAKAWIAERTDPENFAPSQTLVIKARGEAVADIMRALQAGLTPAAFAEVVTVLGADDEGDAEHVEH